MCMFDQGTVILLLLTAGAVCTVSCASRFILSIWVSGMCQELLFLHSQVDIKLSSMAPQSQLVQIVASDHAQL